MTNDPDSPEQQRPETLSIEEMARHCAVGLEAIRQEMLARRVDVAGCDTYRSSVLNLQDYLSLKKHNLSELQEMLSALGLTSLGKAHFHLMYSIDRLLTQLSHLTGSPAETPAEAIGYWESYDLLKERAAFLKPSKASDGFAASTMITLPSDAARNADFVANLAEGHIDICRINTAHDDIGVWHEMAEMIAGLNGTIRRENPIKIYVDLAGPKFRTGPLRQTPAAFKVSWRKTQSLTLVPASSGLETARVPSGDRELPLRVIVAVPDDFYARLERADTLAMSDTESRKREYSILSFNPLMCRIDVKNIYMSPETRLVARYRGETLGEGHPVRFPLQDEPIRLFTGDRLFLTNRMVEGGQCDDAAYQAVISCLTDDFLPYVRFDDTLYIDDGAIALKVTERHEEGVVGEVVRAKPKGSALKPEKGVNFPDSDIAVPAITREDSEILDAILPFADIIGISFAQEPDDVETLKAYLNERERSDIGIIAKIETRKAVRNLPMILLALIPQTNSGVMLARGDLAIEVGFENLSLVQEEIFSLCEAAHVPVIYATQILENLMKKNQPSRSEIIDATIAQRADCIMLNKGPFAKEAVDTLYRILTTTRQLYVKDKPLLHTIEVWKGFHARLQENR